MTTNGTFDSTTMELIVKYKFSVLLSMDGPAEIHNTQRSNSHSVVENNLKTLIKNNISVTVSSVVTKFSVVHWENVANYFYSLGVKSLQYNPVFPFPWSKASINNDLRFSRPNVEQYVDSAFGIYLFGVNNKIHYSNPIYSRLFHPSKYFCDLQAGHQALLINYNGDILNCAEVQDSSHPMYKNSYLGNISELKSATDMRGCYKIEECVNCPLEFICCSGCSKRNELLTNSNRKKDDYYCQISKLLVEKLIKYWISTIHE